jgi:hypothetical protein
MNTIKKQRLTLLVLFMLFLVSGVSGQDWRKIVPLSSTCEDVKALLEVNYCKAPDSFYKFPEMSIYILVSDGKNKWKVPEDTVTRVAVSLRSLPPLKEFVKNFNVKIEDFEFFPDDDLPNSKIYVNNKRGISITVQTIWSNSDEEYVTGVDLYPPMPKKEQSSPSSKLRWSTKTGNRCTNQDLL